MGIEASLPFLVSLSSRKPARDDAGVLTTKASLPIGGNALGVDALEVGLEKNPVTCLASAKFCKEMKVNLEGFALRMKQAKLITLRGYCCQDLWHAPSKVILRLEVRVTLLLEK